MHVLTCLLLIIAPSLLMGLLWLSIAIWAKRVDALGAVFIFASGSAFGQFAIAFIMSILDNLGWRTLLSLNAILILSSLLALLILGITVTRELRVKMPKVHWSKLRIGIFGVATANIAFVLYSNVVVPAFGWDALSWYLSNAVSYIDQELAYNWQNPFFYPDGKRYIQPLTGSLLSAHAAHATTVTDAAYGGLFTWPVLYLSIAGMIYGAVAVITGNHLAAALSTALFVSTPLIENHAAIAGYLELLLCASVVGSASLMAIGMQNQSRVIIGVGALSAILAFGAKNSGFLYAGAQWAILISLLTITSGCKAKVAVAAAMLVVASFAGYIGVDFQFAGYRFLIKPEFEVLSFGGRLWRPTFTPISSVLVNQLFALAVNSSFSIVFPGLILSLIGALVFARSADYNQRNRTIMSALFFSLCAVAIIGLLSIAQVIYEYAFSIAKVGNDTGNSRFTIPAAALGVMAIGVLFHSISAHEKIPRKPL